MLRRGHPHVTFHTLWICIFGLATGAMAACGDMETHTGQCPDGYEAVSGAVLEECSAVICPMLPKKGKGRGNETDKVLVRQGTGDCVLEPWSGGHVVYVCVLVPPPLPPVDPPKAEPPPPPTPVMTPVEHHYPPVEYSTPTSVVEPPKTRDDEHKNPVLVAAGVILCVCLLLAVVYNLNNKAKKNVREQAFSYETGKRQKQSSRLDVLNASCADYENPYSPETVDYENDECSYEPHCQYTRKIAEEAE
eukprot:TRINITY_DN19192_c0_g1_i1.p1 TRINITY_DN19192_c0_g1~~TRINITY_DN19192_c0_g1_i1.p1  ORF type:complete len:248 (+),score=44.25 TRINITY_DN19192_c0_g1_i1:77-820(+)